MLNAIRQIVAMAKTRLTSGVRNPADWFVDWLTAGQKSDSGISINTGVDILRYAPMYYAVSRIAGHVGVMDVVLMQRNRNGERRIVTGNFPEVQVMQRKPNEFQNAQDLKELIQSQAILYGNGRAAIVRNRTGQAIELLPLLPERTMSYLYYRDGELAEKWHVYTAPDGNTTEIPDKDVLHVKGLSADGIQGLSLIDLAKNSIGGGLAGEKHANRTFRNNAYPGMILEAPPGAIKSQAEADEFIDKFNKRFSGLENTQKTLLLRAGIQAKPLSVSGRDAQFIEHRRFQREEAALWTLVESMLGVDQSVAYNSLEQRNQAYLANCLSRWLTKWEQELDAKLLSERQRNAGYYWKFQTHKILRGSLKERLDTYKVGREIELWSQEEMRELEDLPPADPDQTWGKLAAPEPPPVPEDDDQADDQADDDTEDNDDQVSARERFIVAGQVQRILNNERRQVERLAGSTARFLDRVRDHLDARRDNLADIIQSLGAPGHLADDWIDETMAAVVEISGSLPAEDFASNLAAALDDRNEVRATAWTSRILEPERLTYGN